MTAGRRLKAPGPKTMRVIASLTSEWQTARQIQRMAGDVAYTLVWEVLPSLESVGVAESRESKAIYRRKEWRLRA